MEIIFNELARDELKDAIDFYNLELPGLGNIFKEEIKKSIHRILEYPSAWPSITEDIRKYILHKFPYKILYSIYLYYVLSIKKYCIGVSFFFVEAVVGSV